MKATSTDIVRSGKIVHVTPEMIAERDARYLLARGATKAQVARFCGLKPHVVRRIVKSL